LRALKYREMRELYPHLPSHYAYTACQDASTRAKSFLKLREHGVPVIHVDPRNTSRTCPVHGSRITYGSNSRTSKCRKGGELWHRDFVSLWNLLLRARRARLGNGSSALSPGRPTLDGSPVPLGSTATHEPIVVEKPLWARWNSLEATMKTREMIGMSI